jgi:hypothetical protein
MPGAAQVDDALDRWIGRDRESHSPLEWRVAGAVDRAE